MAPKHTASIIACARWETAYITEWLHYHRSIGFDHVYLYCNDDDPTDFYGEVLPFCEGSAPFVTFYAFPFRGQRFHMLMHGLRHHKGETEWVAFLDIDEFLVIPNGNDVKAYLRSCPPRWDAIQVNRSLFGHNNHARRTVGSVLRRYTRRQDCLDTDTKTLTRTARIDLSLIVDKVPFWQSWGSVLGPDFVSVNVIGEPIGQVLAAGPSYLSAGETDARIRSLAYINHYALKSLDDFDIRRERGFNVDGAGARAGVALREAMRIDPTLVSLNAVEDTYLADYWTRRLAKVQQRMVVPTPHLPNVALGKEADQSSCAPWLAERTTRQDAAGAISGRITGGAQCHTAEEAAPWWSVDLGASHLIYEIRVFNRVDEPSLRGRLGAFQIEIWDGDGPWRVIHAQPAGQVIGGADGAPLILKYMMPLCMNRLRIIATGPTFLHLDQVELYGVPMDGAADAALAASPATPAADATGALAPGWLRTLIAEHQSGSRQRNDLRHVWRVAPTGHYPRRAPVVRDVTDLLPGQLELYVLQTNQLCEDHHDIHRVELAGATVCGQGTVFTAGGVVLRDSCWEFFAQGGVPVGLTATSPGSYRISNEISRRIDRPSLLLKRPFWRNYGHWMMDAAMLLALLPDLDLPADIQIVIGRHEDPRMRAIVAETLQILAPGIPVEEHDDHDAWSFAALHYIMPVQKSPLFKLPKAMTYLRGALLTGQARAPRRRLYIQRDDDRRQLENEADIIALAVNHGFEVVRPEHYSLREQAALFHAASCVMGVKGAALTNVMFCAPTAAVLVLSPGDWPDTIFWDLAAQLDIAYGEMFGPITSHARPQGTNPFHIDLARLTGHLRTMLDLSATS